MAKAEKDTQVNEAAFLKSLNKKKAAAKAAAKADRPTGMLDNAAIMARLGLEEENDRITVSARVSKIQMGFAKKDTNRPYFRFAYSLTENSPNSNKGKGLIVSNYHELTEATKDGEVWRTEEQAYEKMYFEFQSLGEVTKDWDDPLAMAVEAAKKHTKNKTEIQISLSVYSGEKGLGLNISVVNVLDNSDIEDSDEESEDEDEVPFSEWVGGWVTWTDSTGSADFKVESYDEDNDTFSGTNEDDEEYTDAPTGECEWCDDQRSDD
jgi:hypothetical protein